MSNIWGFLLQSLQVSLIAGIILIIKNLFTDKMPPGWQYSVWGVLALGLVVPAGLNGYHIAMVPAVYIMTIKTWLEGMVYSRYTHREAAVYNTSFLPYIKGLPHSITDILFVVYIGGVGLMILRYIREYTQLKKALSVAKNDNELQAFVDATAEKYSLKACRVKAVPGLAAPFVFGIMHPVLVLPRDRETDQKVILHELLHLKHHDLQQKVIWSFFRCLHWPNPFMTKVFDRIDNDIESLCDRRVLAKLEGEERRSYGKILLSMTNEVYPSAFGTTSISNGGRFISERIKTIARFKQYPKGMELAAGCMLALLFSLTLPYQKVETHAQSISIFTQDYGVYSGDAIKRERLKMLNVPTVAGALDIFFAGTVKHYNEYLHAVKPAGIEIKEYTYPEDYLSREPADRLTPFKVLNLLYTDKDNCTADLMVATKHLDEAGAITEQTNYYIIPVTLQRQNGSWKAWQSGETEHYHVDSRDYMLMVTPQTDQYDRGRKYSFDTPYGQMEITANSILSYRNENGNWFPYSPVADGKFTAEETEYRMEFVPDEKLKEAGTISISLAELEKTYYDINVNDINIPDYDIDINDISLTDSYRKSIKEYQIFHAKPSPVIKRQFRFSNLTQSLPRAVKIEIWQNRAEKLYSFKFDTRTGEIIE